MVISLAQQGVDAGATSLIGAKALGSIAIQWNTMAYQIGEVSLCIGGDIPVLAPVPEPADPPLLVGLGRHRLRHLPGGPHR